MGFYFRKSINLAKGVRLNLSKSGVSVSLGTKGARFTIGPKGTRTTFSIPNTGIYYTKNYSYKKKEEKENSVSCDEKQLDQYNDYLDNVTKLYKFSYNPIDWQKLSVSKVEYDDSEEIAAEKQYNEIKPNIFMEEGDEIFEKRKQEAYQHFLDVKKQAQEKYQTQNEIVELAKMVVTGDSDSYYQVLSNDETAERLKEYFKDIEFCYIDRYTMAVCVNTDIDRIIPEVKVVKQNNKIIEKTIPTIEYHKISQDYVCSLAIRLAREMFSLLPIDKLVVDCVENDALILSVVFEKDEIENTDFDSLPDASDYIKKYDNHMSFTQTKGFGEVESLLKKLDA